MNLSIGGGTPEQVFQSMARWERDLERHPTALMKIRTIADLETTKQQKKLSLIYGFQDGVGIGTDTPEYRAGWNCPPRAAIITRSTRA